MTSTPSEENHPVGDRSGRRLWRIDDRSLRPDRNDLSLVRLLLASLVIYSHCFYAVYGLHSDDLAGLLGAPVSNYAVDGFFMLSGFLVYRSIVSNPSLTRFALARFVRIWPGLFVMLLIVAIGGLAFTSVSTTAYLTGKETIRFVAMNGTLVFSSFGLTGIRCGEGLCNVNGSLWTLPWEARCYALLALVAACGLTRRGAMLRFVLPATFAFAILWDLAVATGTSSLVGGGLGYQFERLDRLWVSFAMGITCYLLRHRIPLSWGICLLLLAANLLIQRYAPAAGLHARQIFIAYFVLCLGFLNARNGSVSASWPDYSYGMYIYAAPVMMVLQYLVGFTSPYTLSVANLLLTIPFAAASWHFVEKPALDRFRHHYRQKTDAGGHATPMTADVVVPRS
ncbi:acyltransferase family protein [Sphingomonas sp. RS6]